MLVTKDRPARFELKAGHTLQLVGGDICTATVDRFDADNKWLDSTAITAGLNVKQGEYFQDCIITINASAGSVDYVIDEDIFQPNSGTRNVCILGDSTAWRNTSSSATTSYYRTNGPIAMAMNYLGWPWTFEPSDNYAVSGYTTKQVNSIEIPLMLAAHKTQNYERAFISVGTNDTPVAGATFSSITSDLMVLFNALRSVGIIPVHLGIKPRANETSIHSYKQLALQINEWLFNLSISGFIEYIDNNEIYTDNSTAWGNALAAYAPDYLHQNGPGAWLEGRQIANYYAARGYSNQLKFATNQLDTFDRTYNKSGVFTFNPTLQGTGTAPTSFTTTGGTWSMVNRTLPNGQVRTDPTVAAVVSSTLHHIDARLTSTGAWGATSLQPGDVIQGRGKLIITGGANITAVELRITESDGVASFLSSSSILLDAAEALPSGDHVLYLKTPKTTIRPYAGSGNPFVNVAINVSTVASATGALTVQALEGRVVS